MMDFGYAIFCVITSGIGYGMGYAAYWLSC